MLLIIIIIIIISFLKKNVIFLGISVGPTHTLSWDIDGRIFA